MTIDDAIAQLADLIKSASPEAVLRVVRVSAEVAVIRAYAPVDQGDAIGAATQVLTLELLTVESLDVQVLIYDIETTLPPEQG